MDNLDDFDRHILRALQSDGRLTNAELGERVSLSASQCSRRRQRLERDGVIVGYHARINRMHVGVELVSYLSITLSHHDADSAEHLSVLFEASPFVLEAVSMTGSTDYLIKLVVADLKALSSFINETLLPHPSVQQVHTSIVLDILKDTPVLPV